MNKLVVGLCFCRITDNIQDRQNIERLARELMGIDQGVLPH